jgi:hypothetical protein
MLKLPNSFQTKYLKDKITSIAETTFNLFDNASAIAFETLIKKYEDSKSERIELGKKLSNLIEDNQGIPTPQEIEIFKEIMDLLSDEYLSSEHLNSLSEMTVVYLFKSVEIIMKTLIHTAYPKINTKDFYKWENMASFFNSINIKISDFDGYVEVIQLKKVNNRIKHNNTINKEINEIKDFTGETQFTFKNISDFNKRIKPKIQNFIKLLGQEIINDLFVFDDSRVEKISNDFKLRMTKDALQKFATNLTDGH